MDKTNTTTKSQVIDLVAQDFKHAVLIVSLFINLTVFVTWLTVSLS